MPDTSKQPQKTTGNSSDGKAENENSNATSKPRIVINLKTWRSNPPDVPQPSEWSSYKIKRAAIDNGLLVYAMGGTIDGRNGDHLLIAPPYIISAEEIDELVQRLSAAVGAVFG